MSSLIPSRGDVWNVNLEPTRGQEIKKTRPAVVVSSNFLNPIPIRIIVPLTTWQPKFNNLPFMTLIRRTDQNGLNADSAGNVLQIRSISTERFLELRGQVSADDLLELLRGLVICVDFPGMLF